MSAAYPTVAEIKAFLQAGGMEVSAALEAWLPTSRLAAIALFEHTANRKMLAGASSTRYFDPTTRSDGVLILGTSGRDGDLATATTPTVQYQPTGTTATTLVVNQDYYLLPYNAAANGKPWTRIRFSGYRWGEPLGSGNYRSILVTGQWGYSTTLPDDVFLAICQLAGAHALTVEAVGSSGGVKSRAIEDFKVEYGDGQYSSQIAGWAAQAQAVSLGYHRISF